MNESSRKSSWTQQTEWLQFVLLSVSWTGSPIVRQCLTIGLSVHETESSTNWSHSVCCVNSIILGELAKGNVLRQSWTDHTFFFSGRFFRFEYKLVDVIWHKITSEEGKNGMVWTLAPLQPIFCLKNTLIPITYHNFAFSAGEQIFLASRLSCSGALSWKKLFSNSNCKVLFFTFFSVFTPFSSANQTSNYRH